MFGKCLRLLATLGAIALVLSCGGHKPPLAPSSLPGTTGVPARHSLLATRYLPLHYCTTSYCTTSPSPWITGVLARHSPLATRYFPLHYCTTNYCTTSPSPWITGVLARDSHD